MKFDFFSFFPYLWLATRSRGAVEVQIEYVLKLMQDGVHRKQVAFIVEFDFV